MSADRPETPALAEEAAHWLIELEEPGTAVLRRFAAWLETSPRHVEEFLLVAAVWKAFDDFDAERRLDIQRLIDDARNNVLPLAVRSAEELATPLTPRGSRTRRRLAMAAAIVAAVIAGWSLWWFETLPPHTFATARGEQRALKLEDGSVVYLNTQSRLEVHFSQKVRAIRLLEGEAMFSVERDASRPFRVMAGSTVIQAIGTRFNVYRSDAGATISVVEGVVQISPDAASSQSQTSLAPVTPVAARAMLPEPKPTRVSAGEQVRVLRDGGIVKRTVPDLSQIVAWRERRLVFRGDALTEVAAQFNRYNSVQIRVAGDTLASKQITGVFDADDPRSFIQFLERDGELSVEEHGEDILVRSHGSIQ
jgi:transmembrane sensor